MIYKLEISFSKLNNFSNKLLVLLVCCFKYKQMFAILDTTFEYRIDSYSTSNVNSSSFIVLIEGKIWFTIFSSMSSLGLVFKLNFASIWIHSTTPRVGWFLLSSDKFERC